MPSENTKKFWSLTGLTKYDLDELAADKTAEEKKVIGKKLLWMIKAGVILTGDSDKNHVKKLFEEVVENISSTFGVEKPSTIDDIEIEPTSGKKAGDKLSTAEANAYNATLDGAVHEGDVKEEAVEGQPAVYSFSSFGTESNAAYATGKVKVLSQEDGKTVVEVIENNPNDANAADFVGQKFVVNATELGESSYELFTEGGDPTGISVTVALESEAVEAKDEVLWTKEEADTANSQLTGALQADVALTEEQATAYNTAISQS